MENFSWLEPLSQKGYASLTKKISTMYDEINDNFPDSVDELDKFDKLTDEEHEVLRRRGAMEKNLDKIKSFRTMLLETYLPKHNDTFVFAKSGYNLNRFSDYYSDEDLGLFLINDDITRREIGECLRTLCIESELAQIRNRKLVQMPSNRGSPVVNLYGINEIYTSQEQILSHRRDERLSENVLE